MSLPPSQPQTPTSPDHQDEEHPPESRDNIVPTDTQLPRLSNAQRRRAAITGNLRCSTEFECLVQAGLQLLIAIEPLEIHDEHLQVLVLGVTSEVYSESLLKRYPTANIDEIKLRQIDGRILVSTTEAVNTGNDTPIHPWDFLSRRYDLIICDTQSFGHQNMWNAQKDPCSIYFLETRFLALQLNLALRTIHPGGTLVVHLRDELDANVIKVLYHINQFSQLKIWPNVANTYGATFYLLAEKVQAVDTHATETIAWLQRARWAAANETLVLATEEEKDILLAALETYFPEMAQGSSAPKTRARANLSSIINLGRSTTWTAFTDVLLTAFPYIATERQYTPPPSPPVRRQSSWAQGAGDPIQPGFVWRDPNFTWSSSTASEQPKESWSPRSYSPRSSNTPSEQWSTTTQCGSPHTDSLASEPLWREEKQNERR